jgi:hypothetical protein
LFLGFPQWHGDWGIEEQNDLPEELLPTPPPGYYTGEEP